MSELLTAVQAELAKVFREPMPTPAEVQSSLDAVEALTPATVQEMVFRADAIRDLSRLKEVAAAHPPSFP